MTAMNKSITVHRANDVVSKEGLSIAKKNGQLRRENRILKEKYPSWTSDIFALFLLIAVGLWRGQAACA
ncbi:hypothetical protein RGAI101_1854 [Roseobacter sp. GAI101]|nr:hypothetical protein RGAI101_1854 [Roseobacter sp. GAI101]